MLPAIFDDYLGIRLFGYLTFRMAMAALTAFVIALLLGPRVIAWLHAHNVRERKSTSLEQLTRKTEEMGKDRTPTMGGSFLVTSLILTVLLWGRLDQLQVVLAVILTAGLAAVGFVDDYRKLTVENSGGISPKAKMLGLSIVVGGVLAALGYYAHITGRSQLLSLHPPFLKDVVIPLASLGILGFLIFFAFEWLVICGTANACNITDGLDGLAAGCMIISGVALMIFCYVTGRADWSGYLFIPHVPAASEMAVVGGALVGACLGFLWFNAFPAKVFMGDSGSLPLGGLLAWMALVSKQELVLPLIGFVFFIELFSSWLQTFWFRRSGGKRVFTVAPIHHGFQLHGGIFKKGGVPWHEVTIVTRGWIVAAVTAMASLALLKVR